MTHTPLWLAGAFALGVFGCAADSALQNVGDAGPQDGGKGDGSSSASDGGPGADAMPPPGIRIASLPAEIVAVPEGGEEVLFLQGGVLMRVSSDGTDTRSLNLRPRRGFGPTPNLWFWSDLDADSAVGALSSYEPGTSTTTALDPRAATDAFASSPDGEGAIGVTRVHDIVGATSTRTASLEWLPIEGRRRVLLENITLGPWDARTHQHACSPQIEVMSSTRALAIVCPNAGSAMRVLYAIDVTTSSVTEVARDVLSFLKQSEDHSFAMFIDRELRFVGVSANGDRTQLLNESRRIGGVAFLDGPRIAYTTAAKDISVAAWPDLVPTVLLPLGADAIEAVSPDGAYLMFRQTRATTGLRDLFLLGTKFGADTTPAVLQADPSAYPGDDAFSEDGTWAQWFADSDENYIGTISMRPTAGGRTIALAERGWVLLNHADPARVVVLANARFEGDARRLRVDLSVRRRDGADEVRVLASGVDPAAFLLFPERDRAVFRIPEGAHAGIWVRELR